MKTNYLSFIAGIIFGAIPWIMTPIVSDGLAFEPFDNSLAFFTGQFLFSVTAFLLGFFIGLKPVFIFILGIYLCSSFYPMLFGSSEAKAWAGLGFITNIIFCIFPLILGSLGKIFNLHRTKLFHFPTFIVAFLIASSVTMTVNYFSEFDFIILVVIFLVVMILAAIVVNGFIVGVKNKEQL